MTIRRLVLLGFLGQLEAVEPHSGSIHVVALNRDGTILATSGADDEIALWTVADGTLLRRLEPGSRVSQVLFSDDGRWIVADAQDGVLVWGPDFAVRKAAPSASRLRLDGSVLTSLHEKGTVRTLDLESGAGILRLIEPRTGQERARIRVQPTPLPQVAPAEPPRDAREWTNPKDGSVLVFVPSGAFTAGPDDARRQVDLPGFWIGRHEVTNEQFARFLNAVGNLRGPDGVAWHWLSSGGRPHPGPRRRARPGGPIRSSAPLAEGVTPAPVPPTHLQPPARWVAEVRYSSGRIDSELGSPTPATRPRVAA